MSAMTALAGAFSALADTTIGSPNEMGSQAIAAVTLVTLIACSAPLMKSYSEQLTIDQQTYFAASMSIINDPSAAATAAADYMQYQKDSTDMSTASEKLNNMIQAMKTLVQSLGQNVAQVFNMMQTPLEELKSLTQSIMLVLN